MFDHAVPWARAASWFSPDSWPRTGVEFDNFLSIGPYRPKDGSHLCHHATCINQHHVIYEDSGTNSSRHRCSLMAQDMRLLGIEISKYCPRHQPPCLLQHTSLTDFEIYLIQFSILRKAKSGSLPTIEVARPENHPYSTLKDKLPLTFVGDSSTDLHLANLSKSVTLIIISTPVLRCRFYIKVTIY